MSPKSCYRVRRGFNCSGCFTTSKPQRKCSASAYGRSTTCLVEGRFDFAASGAAYLSVMVTSFGLLTATIPRRSPASDQLLKSLQLMGGCQDRKSTRLNSSHLGISYAVFC